MRSLLFLLVAASFIFACNNSSNTSTTPDSSTAPTTTNVENVNGNVPDSNSGMTLNQSLPVDSSKVKDSLKKQ